MHGYDVITSDGHNVGRVVGTDGANLIVEHGTLLKSRYAVPQAVTSTDRSEQKVRLEVSKNVFEEGPKVDKGEIDVEAVSAYYGLADDTAPRTDGQEPAEQQRARIREQIRPEAEEGAPKGARGIHQDYLQVKK
jgi:hypothetical protein